MLRNHHLLSPLFFFFTLFFFFFFFFSLSLSNQSPRDTLALFAFKASSDNRSNFLASWAESTDPCAGSWLGVTCDPKTSRVTKLVLENLSLTGSIQPLTTGLDRLRLLSLNHNFLSSSLNFSSWPHLKHLYLSHNNFTGAFPAAISSLRNLRRLDLSHNQLSGIIPVAELTRLSKLLTLRLESNSLTGFGGSPPSEASSVTFTDFNVSNNNLAGKVPIFLEKFGAATFLGNKRLCGKPLHQDCPNPTAVKPPSSVSPPEAKRHSHNHVVLISVSVALGLMMIAGGVVRWRKSKKKSGSGEVSVTGGKPKLAANGYSYVKRHYGPRELQCGGSHSLSYGPRGVVISGPRESEEMVVLEGCSPGVGYVGNLLKASAELLGKGSVGATYKIMMMYGRDETVVVKRVRERRVHGKEVAAWLRVVGELKHPNIVSLRAYHNSSYELLLVYDFFGNGSLHSLLHGFRGPGRSPLNWSTRMKLALGCAAGLAFIHGSGKGKLYHGHINWCNVFIDDMGNACVADIGLQQLMVAQASSYDAYKAPELTAASSFSPSSKYTRKCDVYSFGVVLMEILTGRMVGEEGEMSLVEWVNTAVKKECGTWEVFDFELLSDKEMEEEMWALFQVGLHCLAAQPKDRPTMNMVVNMMEDIRKKGVRADGTTSILDDISYDTSSASQSTP